ncbi:hypothetical protein BX257_4005 [Streptomyces sp. 3212.3]|uniref:hypothetical protein n=1 Tax=Streptomyces sp. 3212.3 TaxID=1938846 RepID=UPI000E23E5E5|nr:hypothetical protein [Streptomyces sp. 3212.3]REE61427.1 hypothetical protein BX257_4005 [Streptomyces sp. 3212.3]
MTKRGLPHPEHLRLGQVLSGVRSQLIHELTLLTNAYPRTGPRAFPMQRVEDAIEALDDARRALERFEVDEHPDVADVYDYYPDDEHRAVVEVPPKPGASAGRRPFGE